MLSVTARTFFNAPWGRIRYKLSVLARTRRSTSSLHKIRTIETISNDASKLVNQLHTVWAPFAVSEEFLEDKDRKLFDADDLNSSLLNIDMSEIADLLSARIVKSASDGKFIEIDPQLLDEFTLRSIGYACHYHKLAPWLNLELRPNSLVIDSAGGATITHANSSDDFIGTLLVNLNSDYTGGEVNVSYQDRTIELKRKKEWTAIHKACTYKINPILTGHRVDMIFDIYSFDTYAAFDAVNFGTIDPAYCMDIHKNKQDAILSSLRSELSEHNAVVISLAGHYRAKAKDTSNGSQSCAGNTSISPSTLANGDAKLYDLLIAHFNVEIHEIEVHCAVDRDTDRLTVTQAYYLNEANSNQDKLNNAMIVLSNRFHPDNLISTSTSDDGETSLIYHTLALTIRPNDLPL
eukprot:gene22207-25164_t